MNKHVVPSLVCLFALAALGLTWPGSAALGEAAPASAPGRAVSGLFTATQVPCAPGSGNVLCTTGSFTGDVEGPFAFTIDTVTPSGVEGFSVMTGKTVAPTKQGELVLEEAVVANLRSGSFAGLAKVAGGTGKWGGSSGEVRWWSGLTPDGGREGKYTGVITVR